MYTIIGKEDVSYVSKKTNQPVIGTRLYLTYEHEKIDGYGVESVFCNSLIATDHLSVGDQIDVYYNKFGNVAEIGVHIVQ